MPHDPDITTLIKGARRRPLWVDGPSTVAVAHGRAAIEQLLPHRDPFLLVDEITAVDLVQGAIRGRRHVDAADPVFAGHFPGEPVYPGVLQIEIMGQLALCLLHFTNTGAAQVATDAQPLRARATRIHNAQFRDAVRPGDHLEVAARVVHNDDFIAVCAGQLVRDSTVTSLGVMEVYLDEA